MMARLENAGTDKLAQVSKELEFAKAAMGLEANSFKIMANKPELLQAFLKLMGQILTPAGTVDLSLKQQIAFISSHASGCQYCQAHTMHGIARLDVPEQKMQQIWEFKTSEHFSAAERAALDLAYHASMVPNGANDEHFVELKKYFDTVQITEIMSVISAFGFLNRWNDTLATQLEPESILAGEKHLSARGWDGKKHLK